MTQHNFQRWVSLGFAAAGLMMYLLVGRIGEMVWDLARLPYPETWPLTPPEVMGLVSAVVTFLVLRRQSKINTFMNEAAVELSKVTYPPRKETWMSTGVITIVVGICSLFLALYDVVWGWCVKLIY